MAIDYGPFCPVCGGPFSHVEVLDSSQLGEDEQHLKGTAYSMEVLPPAQFFVSRPCFWILFGPFTYTDPGYSVHK